jgi:hypothetical protein
MIQRDRRWAVAMLAGVVFGLSTAPGAAGAPRIPTPVETATSLANRFRAAVTGLQTGNCAAWISWQRSFKQPQITPCNDAARARFARWRTTRVAGFGTGAVISYVSAGHPRGFTISFVLGPGRRWVINDALGPQTGHRLGVGATSPVPWRRSLTQYLRALRQRNCPLYVTYAVIDEDVTEVVACHRIFGPPESALVRDLRTNPSAVPIHFGSTRDWRFYGLRTALHYYTIVVGHYGESETDEGQAHPAHHVTGRAQYLAGLPVRVF